MVTTILSLYITSIISLGDSSTINPDIPPLPVKSITLNKEIAPIPVKNPTNIAPVIKASSAMAIDMGSGEILYQHNPHEQRKLASLTKIMTGVIITEENNLDELVTVSENAASTIGSKMWLRKGEQIKIQNLIYGLFIHSANDAAVALAEHNAGSVEEFVKKMNEKAVQLKLRNTHFANPIGLDDKNNYSSAYDLSILSKYAYRKSVIRHATSLSTIEVESEVGGIKHNLESTNKILDDFLGFKGLKTGYTELAGECFIGIAEKDGHEIMTIILNSPDRFKESKILADWIFRSYTW